MRGFRYWLLTSWKPASTPIMLAPPNARIKLRGHGPRAEANAARRLQQVAPRQRRESMSAGVPPATFELNEALQRRAEAGPRQLECDSCAALSKSLVLAQE